jgi:hypothetical protein
MSVLLTGAGKHGVAAAAYQGPGDVITSGWIAWWGLRAFSVATKGTNCCRVKQNSSDTGDELDIITNATTGVVDNASITSHLAGSTVPGVGRFYTLYDQSGNSRPVLDVGATCLVILTAHGTPYTASGAGSLVTAAIATTFSQPFTVVHVSRTSAGSGQNIVWSAGTPEVGHTHGGAGGANTVYMYAGGGAPYTAAAEATIHALIHVFDGASSVINVDGTDTTGLSTGGSGIGGGGTMNYPSSSGTHTMFECGVYNGILDAGQRASLIANMKTYYGIS